VQLRWHDGVPAHPQTGTSPLYFKPARKLWQFKDGYQMSATVGTVMDRTKIPLTKWFWAAYLVATHTPGISAYQLAKQFGIRYETVYMMLQKLRAGLVDPDRAPLVGTVEMDETFIGGRKRAVRGRGALGKAIVVGAVEVVYYKGKQGKMKVRMGRVRLRVIPDTSSGELMGFLVDHVAKGTQVCTDGWRGYMPVVRNGYRHKVLVGETSVEVAEQLVHIHRVFSNLKTWILGTHHGVSAKHLQAYLNEFTFRFNHRMNAFSAFRAALGISTRVEGPEYEEIYSVGEEGGWRHANPKE
jgi:transposase-like protein